MTTPLDWLSLRRAQVTNADGQLRLGDVSVPLDAVLDCGAEVGAVAAVTTRRASA
jgi:hypothetical protein